MSVRKPFEDISQLNVDQNHTDVKQVYQDTDGVSPSIFDWNNIHVRSTSSYTGAKDISLNKMEQIEMTRTNYISEGGTRSTFDFRSTSDNARSYKSNGFAVTNDERGEDTNIKKQKTGHQFLSGVRVIVVLACVALGTVGVVVLITMYHEDPNEQRTDKLKTPDRQKCSLESANGYIRFNQPMEILCSFDEDVDLRSHNYSIRISFESMYSYIQNNTNVEAKIASQFTMVGMWNVTVQGKKILLRRGPVKCDSDGVYSIYIKIDDKQEPPSNITVRVQSEMSEIDFQVGRQSDTSDLYDITCSATSECTPIPMLLLGTIGDRTVPLFGSNFECVIRYFEETGWSANCTGTMAKGVLESFGSILCRTSTTENVTTGEPQETSLTKQQFLCDDEDCVFGCPVEDGDKFYLDPTDCKIFHRCVDQRLYTRPCADKTFFNTATCSCDHENTVEGCDQNGFRPINAYSIKKRCDR